MTNSLKTQFPSRRRVRFESKDKSITDQTLVNEFSMASIKSKLERHMPITNISSDIFYSLEPQKYTNLQDALAFNDRVRKNFESLPVGLRKEMGHDVRNFESFIKDPKNEATLVKYGLLKKRDVSNADVVDSIKDLKLSLKSDEPTPPLKTSPNKQK